jgi:isopentenyl-diphosphate Delta-isomerase
MSRTVKQNANASATRSVVVSSDEERLILVDSDDRVLGAASKSHAHDGAGVLHRAFSLFVFNRAGALLIHQRHPTKRLWPGYWSNSCCSHPRAGEDIDVAVGRRLEQELGLTMPLAFIYKFEYTARFGDAGTEHELCSVYAGVTNDDPVINETEIADWRWIAPDALDAEIERAPQTFTPWFKLEWRALREDHRAALENALSA